MDIVDLKILKCLKEYSRMNATAIGEKINLSTSAVIERIKKLENDGVISQYTILINHEKIDKDIIAYISVSIEHPKFDTNFRDMVRLNDEIVECHYITGEYDYILKVVTSSSKSLESLLNYVKCIQGVNLTKTLVVMSTIKNEISSLPTMVEEQK
ncbi:MAG: Lrp/AsnC family transcriptional regulator [Clostridia bacterium]|nr:Lrp/AsnC family transcriptional regulator [Clostridia bacterium]